MRFISIWTFPFSSTVMAGVCDDKLDRKLRHFNRKTRTSCVVLQGGQAATPLQR
jgi:hypothetical protein